mgnify:CR=1 FL=1
MKRRNKCEKIFPFAAKVGMSETTAANMKKKGKKQKKTEFPKKSISPKREIRINRKKKKKKANFYFVAGDKIGVLRALLNPTT